MMTALSFILGVIPLLIATGAGGERVEKMSNLIF